MKFVAGSVADMLVVPAATAVARPGESIELLIVETRVFDELHVTDDVRSLIESSVYVPVAENCRVESWGMVGFFGVIVIIKRTTLLLRHPMQIITDTKSNVIMIRISLDFFITCSLLCVSNEDFDRDKIFENLCVRRVQGVHANCDSAVLSSIYLCFKFTSIIFFHVMSLHGIDLKMKPLESLCDDANLHAQSWHDRPCTSRHHISSHSTFLVYLRMISLYESHSFYSYLSASIGFRNDAL